MILSTTRDVAGRPLTETVGLVASEVAVVVDDSTSREGARDVGLEALLGTARLAALQELIDQAVGMNADAVVEVRLSYTSLGLGNTYGIRTGRVAEGHMLVAASGTAVKLG